MKYCSYYASVMSKKCWKCLSAGLHNAVNVPLLTDTFLSVKNLLYLFPLTSQVCDLVSALMEVSFLVLQKVVQPGGLMGLLGTEADW